MAIKLNEIQILSISKILNNRIHTIQVGSDFIQHALGFGTTNTTVLILFVSVKPLRIVTFSITINQLLIFI